MDSSAAGWDPVAAGRAGGPAAAQGGLRGFLRFAGANKAWWIVPFVLTLAAMAALVLLARGDLSVPVTYRLS